MSISSTTEEEKISKFYSNKNFKKIVGGSIKSISGNAINLPLGFSIIATAIGEVFNQDLSIKWYSLLIMMLGIYLLTQKQDGKTNTKTE